MQRLRQEDISRWASRIDTLIGSIDNPIVRRVVVIESTPSTQDSALRFARGEPGLLLVASEQTAGRGSRGRAWDDGDRSTLPCTLVLDPGRRDAPTLAACIACALHETLVALPGPGCDLRIKWPNDIVVREDASDRKLAGILIEQRGGLTLVGIGINCNRQGDEWPPELRDTAVSLGQLGLEVTRLDLVCRLVEHMSQWCSACDRDQIREYYSMHDAMVGTLRTFRHNNNCHHGVVEHLDPLGYIVINTPAGLRHLPVTQTTHKRGDGPCTSNTDAE